MLVFIASFISNGYLFHLLVKQKILILSTTGGNWQSFSLAGNFWTAFQSWSAKHRSYPEEENPIFTLWWFLCFCRNPVLRKESLATQLQITETQLKLAQLNASIPSPASDAVATTPPSSLKKLRSAIAPTAASSPGLPLSLRVSFTWPAKTGASLPNNFVFSSKGTVEYDKLELAEFVRGYLEFCKEQPESSKAPLFKHLHLLMERAITYSWSSVRNFHLFVNNAVQEGRLSWHSFESVRERAQTFVTHQDLRSNQSNSLRNASQPAHGKAKDLLCKEYTGKFSCAISDANFKAFQSISSLLSMWLNRPRYVNVSQAQLSHSFVSVIFLVNYVIHRRWSVLLTTLLSWLVKRGQGFWLARFFAR